LDDLCTHENASPTAIATRPARESDIKYEVMLLASLAIVLSLREAKRWSNPVLATRIWISSRSLSSGAHSLDRLARNDEQKICGMIAGAIISGANPIPPRAIRMADRRGETACDVD
jgi:hypothetical protein